MHVTAHHAKKLTENSHASLASTPTSPTSSAPTSRPSSTASSSVVVSPAPSASFRKATKIVGEAGATTTSSAATSVPSSCLLPPFLHQPQQPQQPQHHQHPYHSQHHQSLKNSEKSLFNSFHIQPIGAPQLRNPLHRGILFHRSLHHLLSNRTHLIGR